jgi:hypothetical protein
LFPDAVAPGMQIICDPVSASIRALSLAEAALK